LSYGELAARAGSPGASRAVGQAMAKNRLPIVVPCHRVLAAGGRLGGFSAHGEGATKARMLEIEGVQIGKSSLFHADGKLPFDWAAARAALAAADRRLARVIERTGDRRLEPDGLRSPFAALAEAIMHQQLNGKAAASIHARVKALGPRGRFPTPAQLLALPAERLRSAGLSSAKVAALTDLALKCEDGHVPSVARLRRMADDEIVERLTAIRGIGRWTVEMLLIFRLGRPDVLPVDDFGVRKGFARLHKLDELPTPRSLLEHGERWRPYRTVAAWYLWRVLDN
jgi:O-6-methylguanine DNA methyltransferase